MILTYITVLANDLNYEHNWSQERTINGFNTIEEVEEKLNEVCFIEGE